MAEKSEKKPVTEVGVWLNFWKLCFPGRSMVVVEQPFFSLHETPSAAAGTKWSSLHTKLHQTKCSSGSNRTPPNAGQKNRAPKALRSPAVGTCCCKYKALPASSQKSRAKDPTILQGAFPFLLSPAMIKDRPPTEKLTPDKVPKLRGTTRASNEKLTQRSGKHIFSSISKIQQTSKNSQSTHVLFFILLRKAKKKK